MKTTIIKRDEKINPDKWKFDGRRKHLYISVDQYALYKNRKEGESDLHKLAISQPFECGWMFSDNIWLNVTEEIHYRLTKKGELQHTGAVNFVLDFSWFKENVSHYHIHPLQIESDYVKYFNNCNERIQEYNSHYIAVLSSLPSSYDVRENCNTINAFRHEHADFRIVSNHGTSIMKFNAETVFPERVKKKYMKCMHVNSILETAAASIKSGKSKGETIIAHTKFLNDSLSEYFTIDFSPSKRQYNQD